MLSVVIRKKGTRDSDNLATVQFLTIGFCKSNWKASSSAKFSSVSLSCFRKLSFFVSSFEIAEPLNQGNMVTCCVKIQSEMLQFRLAAEEYVTVKKS